MKKTLFLSVVLSAVFSTSALADIAEGTYGWDNSHYVVQYTNGEWQTVEMEQSYEESSDITLNNSDVHTVIIGSYGTGDTTSINWKKFTANSPLNVTWFAANRTNVSDTANMGTIYAVGGQVNFVETATYSNDIFFGVANTNEQDAQNANDKTFAYAAIRTDSYKDVTLSGTLTQVSDISQISINYGKTLTLSGILNSEGKTLSFGAANNPGKLILSGESAIGTLKLGNRIIKGVDGAISFEASAHKVEATLTGTAVINELSFTNGSTLTVSGGSLTITKDAYSIGKGLILTQGGTFNLDNSTDAKITSDFAILEGDNILKQGMLSVTTLDLSKDNECNGSLRIQNAEVTMTTLWMNNQENTALYIDSDASLTWKSGNQSAKIIGQGTGDKAAKITSSNNSSQDIFGANRTIKNAVLTYTGKIANQSSASTMTNVDLIKHQDSGTLTIENANSTFRSMDVSGTLNYTGAGDETAMNSLTLNAGATLTLGTVDTHTSKTLTTSALTVHGNSTLNANLVVSSDGKMDFSHTTSSSGVLTMGCTVTIGEESGTVTVVLNSSEINAIQHGQQLVLIDGVDGSSLDEAITIHGTILFEDQVGNPLNHLGLALQGVKYNTNSGSFALVVTPEPATATLSLLALAGLAARRRRH